MPLGKITPETVESLGLCWTLEESREGAAKGGQPEYTVAELMEQDWVSYDNAMWMVCRTTVTPGGILRKFATQVARDQIQKIRDAFPSETAFQEALNAAESDDEEKMGRSSRATHKATKRLTERLREDPKLLKMCQAIRGCVKADPGGAAVVVGHNAVEASDDPDAERARQRALMARLFREGV